MSTNRAKLTPAAGGVAYNPGDPFLLSDEGGFGPRRRDYHVGLDYKAPVGTPIPAASGGEVVYSGPSQGFHYAVIVKSIGQDGGIYYSVYGHLDPRGALPPGAKVSAGEEIGKVGATHPGEGEISDGPHTHFGIITQDAIDDHNDDNGTKISVAPQGSSSGGIGFRTGQTELFVNPDKFTGYTDGAPYNARTYIPIRDGLTPRSVPYLAQSQEADRLFSENPSIPAHLFPGGANRLYADTRDPVANPSEAIANGSLRVATPGGVASGPPPTGFPRDNSPTSNLSLDATQAAQRLFGSVPPSNAPFFPMQTSPDGAMNPVTPQTAPGLPMPQNNRRSAIPDGVTPTSMQTVSVFVPAFSSAPPFDLFHIGPDSTNAGLASPSSLFSRLMSGGPDSLLAADDTASQPMQRRTTARRDFSSGVTTTHRKARHSSRSPRHPSRRPTDRFRSTMPISNIYVA